MVIVEVDGATEDVQRELAWLCALMQGWYLRLAAVAPY
jgi:hypothetical protein